MMIKYLVSKPKLPRCPVIVMALCFLGILGSFSLSEGGWDNDDEGEVVGQPKASNVVTTQTKQGVTITASMKKKLFAGEKHYLVVVIKNEGKSTLYFEPRRHVPGVILACKKGKYPTSLTHYGQPLVGELSYRTKAMKLTELKPGMQVEMTVNLPRYCDLTVSGDYSLSISWIGWVGDGVEKTKLTLSPDDLQFYVAPSPSETNSVVPIAIPVGDDEER